METIIKPVLAPAPATALEIDQVYIATRTTKGIRDHIAAVALRENRTFSAQLRQILSVWSENTPKPRKTQGRAI